MKSFEKKEINELEHLYKINLINSCTGFKSANLIGSTSKDSVENLAVFSSITHFGSEPPLLGIVFRPTTVKRNTYDNIKETDFFSINHIHQSIIRDAHHTSAKYPFEINEFDQTNLKKEYKGKVHVPFVKGAPVQMLMKYINEYTISENGTILVLAEIKMLYVNDDLIRDDGFIDLAKAGVVTINGLDGYAKTELIERLPYQKPRKLNE